MKRPVTFPLLMMSVCLIALSGCATAPTQAQRDAADYGSPMVQTDAQAQAKQWFSNILKDPESARYQWDKFEQGWVANGLLDGGGHLYGYVLYCKVNAKNSFGGYTGYKEHLFIFKNNKITGVWGREGSPDNPFGMIRLQ